MKEYIQLAVVIIGISGNYCKCTDIQRFFNRICKSCNLLQKLYNIHHSRHCTFDIGVIWFRTPQISNKMNNKNQIYLIAFVVIIVAFLLLGGGPWVGGMMHGNNSLGIGHINWVHILISLALGFLLGLIASKRKWL